MSFKENMNNTIKGACNCGVSCAAVSCSCKCSGGFWNTAHNNQIKGSSSGYHVKLREPGPRP